MVICPSWQEIQRIQKRREGVVISAEISPAPDPAIVFLSLQENQVRSYWLDSARFHPNTGRYSFIGLNPIDTFHEVNQLREILNQKKAAASPGLPPFTAGLIGYFSYEGESEWVQVQTVISWDHQENRCWVAEPFYPGEQGEKEYREIIKRLFSCHEMLLCKMNVGAHCNVPLRPNISNIQFEMTQSHFEQMVLRAKEYIAAGDIYQVNLSQRISADISGDPVGAHCNVPLLYLRLREINPSPFACYLPMSKVTIAGCSPERLLRVQGDLVETRPIAGTRPRVAQNRFMDHRYAEELLLSPKERAEHVMLMDLERNDLGRVCEYGSVEVNELMTVEEYSHVRHIVSNVQGRLRKDRDRLDAVEAAFPGGTITGTPKIRAMEIIEELEPVKRGLYTGSVGYLSFSGEMDLNIVIRTFVVSQGKLFIQVGAGIVADSIPEKEYEETLRKGQALLEAVQSMRNVEQKSEALYL
ncbi:MAG: anthranilate synthase component I family protein [Candidatus Omnitrophica bacterium]|nr:anthranilate synthase component I family protein [Candidatus Omnitrophota bacterium]